MRKTVPYFTIVACCGMAMPSTVALAQQELGLPTKVVMTEQDFRDINERRMLRGRTVNAAVYETTGTHVWDGLQVFVGRKADVLLWFETGQQGLQDRGGFRGVNNVRHFQYDLLCSQLLRTRDLDIMRAVIRNSYPTGIYCEPDLEAAVLDERLGLEDRIMAYSRLSRDDQEKAAVRFWQLFGRDLSSAAILRIHQATRFPFEFFGNEMWERPPVNVARADELLLSLVKREYLSVVKGTLVEGALRALRNVRPEHDHQFTRTIVDALVELDGIGDKRSPIMWTGAGDPRKWDSEVTARVRTLVLEASVPANAGRAFYDYLATPDGQARVVGAEGGLQKYFEEYLRMAFGKPDLAADYLQALWRFRDTQKETWVTDYASLGPRLRQGDVQLVVSPDQKRILEVAWADAEGALRHVRTEGEDQTAERPVPSVRVLAQAPPRAGIEAAEAETPTAPTDEAVGVPVEKPVPEELRAATEPQPVAPVSPPWRFGTWELLVGLAAGIVIGSLAVALIRRRQAVGKT